MEFTISSALFNGKIEREVIFKERLPSGHHQQVVIRVWVEPDDSIAALNTAAVHEAIALLSRVKAHPLT